MKPAEHKISDASFIGHFFKLFVIRLKQFRTAKHIVLIGVVLICLLARYVVLLGDNNQIKIQSVTEKYQKIRVRVPKLIFVPSASNLQNNNHLELRQVKFELLKNDFKYIITNERQ